MPQGPPLVVPQATAIRIIGAVVGAPCINVLHAINPGGVTINQALANTLDTALKSAWLTNLATAHCSSSMHFLAVGVRDLRAANMAEYIGVGADTVGGLAADVLPSASAVCISLKTAKAGARYRGRVYLGGFTETDNTAGGAILAGLNTACVAWVTAIQSALTSNGLQLAVLSSPAYASSKTVTTTHADGTSEVNTHVTAARPGEINAVTSITARNAIWDSQRRRASAGSGGSLFALPVAASYSA